ncbi:hypothetical protein HDU85_005037 [Gaertneriomyces sp. JEL0708]|nr:hypothetical protein HDU85_005037 [Gaertneriomyces sp. JEL0708]
MDKVGLNVIIPIGGIGSRFSQEGYRYPKPLINIAGRPMLFCLIDQLKIVEEDTVFIAIRDTVDDEFHLALQLQKEYPQLDIHLVRLVYDTKDSDKPIFSYVAIDQNSYITRIEEKQAISRNANTGAYIFASGYFFRKRAAEFLDGASQHASPEYYTSILIAQMIKQGYPFKAIQIDRKDFNCVGTPHQLRAFLSLLKENALTLSTKKRRFCFDLDSTLVSLPVIPGDYGTCRPVCKAIHLVRELNAQGHYIIIQTARRMKTHKGNVGAVMRDIGRETFAQLDKFGIPYDELVFGKPYAHVYIDDLAVNARLDTHKELGWWTAERETVQKQMIAPRHFNNVQLLGNTVHKSSTDRSILGEILFYSGVPDSIRHLFPAMSSCEYLHETGTYAMTLEKLEGVTFSHLLVNGGVTKGRFRTLLAGLLEIHDSSGVCSHPKTIPPNILEVLQSSRVMPNVYANYATKVASRFDAHRAVYDALDPGCAVIKDKIIAYLHAYEQEDRATRRNVIHGDPVFSNVILQTNNTVAFLDMRGRLGDQFSIHGDAVYDLAKVYQSLQGYDFALLTDQESNFCLSEAELRNLQELQGVFWEHCRLNYPDVRCNDIKVICASLLFSLIPLHDAKHHLFFEICASVLDETSDAAPTACYSEVNNGRTSYKRTTGERLLTASRQISPAL